MSDRPITSKSHIYFSNTILFFETIWKYEKHSAFCSSGKWTLMRDPELFFRTISNKNSLKHLRIGYLNCCKDTLPWNQLHCEGSSYLQIGLLINVTSINQMDIFYKKKLTDQFDNKLQSLSNGSAELSIKQKTLIVNSHRPLPIVVVFFFFFLCLCPIFHVIICTRLEGVSHFTFYMTLPPSSSVRKTSWNQRGWENCTLAYFHLLVQLLWNFSVLSS